MKKDGALEELVEVKTQTERSLPLAVTKEEDDTANISGAQISVGRTDFFGEYGDDLKAVNPDTGLPKNTRFWKVADREYTPKGRYFHAEHWLTECNHSGDSTGATRTALKDDMSLRIQMVSTRVDNVSEINLVDDTFRVESVVTVKWLAKCCEVADYYKAKREGRKDTWVPRSTPNLVLENVVKYHSTQVESDSVETGDVSDATAAAIGGGFVLLHHHSGIRKTRSSVEANKEELGEFATELLGFDPTQAWWCRASYTVDATIAEEFETQCFPFEEQDLGIGITVRRQLEQCSLFLDLVPDFTAVKMHKSLNLLADSGEWDMAGVVVESGLSDIKWPERKILEKSGVDVSQLKGNSIKGPPRSSELWVTLKLLRKSHLYAADLLSVFIIWTLSLCNFSMGYDYIAERLAYVVTLMLAISLTKNDDILGFSVIEHYRMAAMGFLGAVAVFDSLKTVFSDSNRLNLYGFLGFLAAYICLHLAFAYRIYKYRVFARSLVTKRRDEVVQAYQNWFGSDLFGHSLCAHFAWSYLTPEVFRGLNKADGHDIVFKRTAF